MIKSPRAHRLIPLALCGTAALLASCSPRKTTMPTPPNSPQESVQPYSQKIRFRQGKPLQFADFILTFDGQTHVKVERYPNGFVYENFTVTAKGVPQKIIWTMGTGVLDPTDFSVAGQPFMLELKSSDILGPMEEDQLVVWRQKEWQQRSSELHPTVR